MIDAGAFAGVDAAMMVHPAGADLRGMNTIAVQQLWSSTTAEARARGVPVQGAQRPRPRRCSGTTPWRRCASTCDRRSGCTASSPRPAPRPTSSGPRTAVWYVRAKNLRRLEQLKPRVLACLQGGADAAGCEMTYDWKTPVFADMVDNDPFSNLSAASTRRRSGAPC